MRSALSDKADYSLYEESARQYDRVRFRGMAGNWGHRRQVEILESLADDWQGKKVLEIGCGTGRITEMLARWGAHVTATDVSREMLAVAQARLKDIAGVATPEFRVMSVFDIDIDLKGYDFVIMINVLGRLSNPFGAIRQVASRMSRDCRFVFTFPCLTSVLFPFGLWVNAGGKSLSRNVTSRWYRPDTIRDLCSAAGLNITSFHGNHYVPMPRLLFPTLPLFWCCDRLLAESHPTRCPSVFAECRLSEAAVQ
jgi:2-polyprenyl-3-methyl-5-hydroxy-6-metoxy-1,4-benzoquinol methylase